MVFFKSFRTGNKYTMDLESNLEIYRGEFLRSYCTRYIRHFIISNTVTRHDRHGHIG